MLTKRTMPRHISKSLKCIKFKQATQDLKYIMNFLIKTEKPAF